MRWLKINIETEKMTVENQQLSERWSELMRRKKEFNEKNIFIINNIYSNY